MRIPASRREDWRLDVLIMQEALSDCLAHLMLLPGQEAVRLRVAVFEAIRLGDALRAEWKGRRRPED